MEGLLGRTIGRYALFQELASGGMATVHLGRLLGTAGFSRTVAIKRLHPQFAKDPEFASMFLDEARLAARIRHPNVVTTLDVVALEGELFLVMEYVQGETLSRLVRATSDAHDQVPVPIAAAIVYGALHGLHAAHEARSERGRPLQIVHRDVSPQNILVGVDGIPRVLDFGIAKAAGRFGTTRAGMVRGKIPYMAPEQLSSGVVTRSGDVYAAAVVFWEALTSKRLFLGDNAALTAAMVLTEKAPAPSSVASDIPPDLDAIVLRGLQRDPAIRFTSALEMATAIERAVALAPQREIGEWVEQRASAQLKRRAELVSLVESSSSSSSSIPPPPSNQTPSVQVIGLPMTTDSGGLARQPPGSSFAELETIAAPVAAELSPPGTARIHKTRIAVASVVVLLLLVGAALWARRSAHVGASTLASGSASGSDSARPAMSESAQSSSATAGSASGPPPSASSAPAPAESHTAKPPGGSTTKPTVRPNCKPPWRLDADGIRHLKPECI